LAQAQVDIPSIAHQYSEALAMVDVGSAVAAGQLGGLRRAISERPGPPNDAVWSLINTKPNVLILGDLAVIGRTADGYCHPMQPDTELQAILLPIGHQHLLVGTLTSTSMMGPLDPEEVNLASVELSRDFFVASQNTDRERRYQTRLGARAQFSGLSEMFTEIALQSFTGEVRTGGETPPSPNPAP
jgi:hypothetical protein